ncbi:PAAR-like domain-containing protein [Marinobacter lacisalsi]|uniref:PAAR-like domain-containing protein n=1 Tax=Marinobacter lacisalsi TaxID=475979 RepID=A0ABV8QMP5_9GAMM
MGKPIAPADQIAFAFPDVCNTPAPPASPVPVPYPNIAQLADAGGITNEPNQELLVGGKHVLLKDSLVDKSTGNEAGSVGGVSNGSTIGQCTVTTASQSVKYGPEGLGIARFLDQTEQNDGNAVGMVLSANPTVLVGD